MKSCPTCQAGYPTHFAVCPQDGTPLVEYGAWAEGTVIRGKYRILEKIGQGGMGSVYKALHVNFDELRAIKVISPELVTDETFVRRFKHEAVITRKLQHPNAVRVDDIDESEDGRPFIVMEYIEGRTLRKVIEAEGSMPVSRTCAIIKQVAAALDAAHRLGMIHRDIKPDNIVLIETPQGEQAKVLDFGIAKIKESRMGDAAGMTLTGTGVVIGTPQYMSPEQAMGKRGDELDGRSDLYSLGIVMYQMLTADLPFKADTTMAMILAHLQARPTPFQSARPDLNVPESVAALVMRLLEKQPNLRPSSAGALIAEIESAESQVASPRETLRSLPDNIYSPHAAAGKLQSALRGTPVPESPRAQTPAAQVPEAPPSRSAPAPSAAPRAAVAPPHAVPMPQPRPAKSSQWGIWAAVAVLIVGLAGGGWYISSRSTTPEVQTQSPKPAPVPSAAATTTTSPQTKPPAKELESAQPAVGDRSAPGIASEEAVPARITDSPPVTSPRRHARAIRESEPLSPTIEPKRITAAIKMGDFYFGRGDYDSAVAEYRRGLGADPNNRVLRAKIERARRAKAAEEKLNQ